ncbi:MAG TPA: hypothetical protein ENI32_02900 [Candidatus Syntrophoarchaeum butanivorans]|uniref:Uncharacterized protein n=1 Tax=Candidatus Syntropharchaeum butanivorans TaxID=1839936 RepID=A0A1F2P3B1_9EURY|nr:MAG: hypothetical protein SBU_001448 [Candidatus Syntrophoarchaeum butanivorans]HEC56820.1 hypothetical protein [Candidatus Syntrophoarchaeum butanivorans]
MVIERELVSVALFDRCREGVNQSFLEIIHMLLLERGCEISIHKSGKIIIKTGSEESARKEV